jgi:hypothetical protein
MIFTWKISACSGRMGTVLDVGPAGPHHALPYTRRHHLGARDAIHVRTGGYGNRQLVLARVCAGIRAHSTRGLWLRARQVAGRWQADKRASRPTSRSKDPNSFVRKWRPCPEASRVDLAVSLGRLRLPNPVMVGSGTFGYAREMAAVDLSRLARSSQDGDAEPRRQRVAHRRNDRRHAPAPSADNDGLEIHRASSYLRSLGPPVVVSITGRNTRICGNGGTAGCGRWHWRIELNISC